MIIFKKLRLRNLLFYEDQTFDLGTPGVKLILGKNLNSSSDNPNGAGKSLFFSQLPELLLNEQLHGTRRDVTREGSVSIALSVSTENYVVIRAFSPKETIRIALNGKDLEFRELAEARAFLTSLVPYSSDEVRSLLHLDSQLPHPLITGDTVQRKNFFTSFFKLGVLESMRKKVRAEIASLREADAALDELRSSAIALRSQVDPDCERKQSVLAALQSQRDDLQSKMSEWVAAESANARLYSLSTTIEYMQKHGLIDEESCAEHWKRLNSKRKDLSSKLSVSQAHYAWEQALSSLPEVDASSLRAEASKIKLTLDRADIAAADQRSARILNNDILSLVETLNKLKAAYGKCPTCGAPFDDAHAGEEILGTEVKLDSKRSSVEKLGLTGRDLLTSSDYERLESRLDDISAARATAARRASLTDNEPERPVESPQALTRRLLSIEDRVRSLKDYTAALEAMRDVRRFKGLDSESLYEAQAKFVELSNRCNVLYSEVDKSKSASAQLSALGTRAKVLKERLKDKEALSLLENAFSRKGVESLLIKSLCESLEVQINKYSKLLFPEDYQFSLELETQFLITVTRKYGKKVVSSDVRKLSGAEKKLFALVLLVSLLTFVPKSRRSNLLILDEPTAAMGPENVSRFVRFLPMLQSVIPSIVVITPLDPKEYASISPSVFTVIKDRKGVSRIEKSI